MNMWKLPNADRKHLLLHVMLFHVSIATLCVSASEDVISPCCNLQHANMTVGL